MLTLKIRVPYKEGSKEIILEALEESLREIDDVHSFGIVDGSIQIEFNNGKAKDITLDTKLLEILGG